MKLVHCVFLVSLWISAARSKVTEGPWLLNGEPVPEEGIRITTLGSGTPDVRKDQVSSGFLLELGNGDKFIWDLGTGSYANLLSTAVPAKDLTKVLHSRLCKLLLHHCASCLHLTYTTLVDKYLPSFR